jgi:hypothetical protein
MIEPKKIVLKKGEYVVAVVPEIAAGPGWANSPTWVIIKDPTDNSYREECIQPEERTIELSILFKAGWILNNQMIAAVPTKVSRK